MTASSATGPASAAVSVRDLRHRFGRTSALDGVSLSAGVGVTGLLGPNGAGKTTLLRVLATVLAPQEGTVRLLGRDPSDDGQRREIRRRLGYLPQDAGMARSFTAFELVDYVAVLKEMTDRRTRHDEVRRVLALVDLADVSGKKVRALSGGMKRRLGLAQALLGDPDLLVLDEPTVGLDPEQRLRFRDLVSRAGEGRAVVLSTHQVEDVAALCEQVVVVDRGRALFAGSVQELVGRAVGCVWVDDARDPSALASWRLGTGAYHHVGTAPVGARLVDPSLEDAYLLLLGDRAGAAVPA
jgi:ABC-2 type transport system ATP-binding protein